MDDCNMFYMGLSLKNIQKLQQVQWHRQLRTLQIKLTCLEEELKNDKLQVSLSWMHGICKERLGSHVNTEGKRSFVYVWQTSTDVKKSEDKAESLEKMKTQLLANDLKKGWLKASIDKLKTNNSKESRQNILGWLQESLKRLKEDSSKASKQILEKWLKDTFQNLEEKSPEASKPDAKKWLEISINNLVKEEAEAPHLDTQRWLEASIRGIQDFKEQYSKASKANMEKTRERVIIVEPASSESCLRPEWLQASVANLQKRGSKASRMNVQQWLQASLKSFRQESPEEPRKNLEDWLKESIKHLQKECPEASRQDVNEWLDVSINHLREEGPETSHLNVQEWLEASMKGLQEETLKEKVKQLSKASVKI
ncbi:centrosomal protein of 131 kDa-like [Python bivittatus]|uniref:Centrosomal protein of 131 kDa-like n=1 Tax=Python bivittatus TaxID=176946 RepID=A0A9F5MXI6_PYTBI|nr:centrosomal protein of 131 kDa-like [Python bivittatus]